MTTSWGFVPFHKTYTEPAWKLGGFALAENILASPTGFAWDFAHMNGVALVALFFVACLVFYYLGRQSLRPSQSIPSAKLPDGFISDEKMLPGLRQLPNEELRITKLTIGMMVAIGRAADAEMFASIADPQRFVADGMRFISQFQLNGRSLEHFKQRYGLDIYPNAVGMCIHRDTRAKLPAAFELFGVNKEDAKSIAEWCNAVFNNMPLSERMEVADSQNANRCMTTIALASDDLSDFMSRVRSKLQEEAASGGNVQVKTDPEFAQVFWDSETVRLSRECKKRLSSGMSEGEVDQWLRVKATSPFTYYRVQTAVFESNTESWSSPRTP